MEVTEKQLDDAIEDISDAICRVAYAVLDEEDAEMFLDALNDYFGEWNRLIDERKK
tara:strand:+ start:588 stop:755 length:168 start_codon:yes stop_codon:yes gene_type:complete